MPLSTPQDPARNSRPSLFRRDVPIPSSGRLSLAGRQMRADASHSATVVAVLCRAASRCATREPPAAPTARTRHSAADPEAVAPRAKRDRQTRPPAGDPRPAKRPGVHRSAGPPPQPRARSSARCSAVSSGPAGAAVGAGVFGLYGLIVGKPPLDSGRDVRRGRPSKTGGDSDKELDAEIEERRQDDLENEIEDELKRQEELLEQISRQEEAAEVDRGRARGRSAAPSRSIPSPLPPHPRTASCPTRSSIASERKQGQRTLLLKTLDADRDGRAEIEIAYDQKSGKLLSRQEDTDYDGLFDVAEHLRRARPGDRAQRGHQRRRTDRSLDHLRRRDARRASRSTATATACATASTPIATAGAPSRSTTPTTTGRSTAASSTPSTAATSRSRIAISTGAWRCARSTVPGDVPVRAEIDRSGDGKPDVWEHYEGSAATQVALARKEEDVNGDGNVDVTSYYSKGKLVRKEVSDPSLVQSAPVLRSASPRCAAWVPAPCALPRSVPACSRSPSPRCAAWVPPHALPRSVPVLRSASPRCAAWVPPHALPRKVWSDARASWPAGAWSRGRSPGRRPAAPRRGC